MSNEFQSPTALIRELRKTAALVRESGVTTEKTASDKTNVLASIMDSFGLSDED